MDIKKLLGKKIREYRVKNSLTQQALAELVEVDGKYLSCIELGKNMPNPQVIYRIALVFKIEIKDLFDFHHLQENKNLKQELHTMIDGFSHDQIQHLYKYVKNILA